MRTVRIIARLGGSATARPGITRRSALPDFFIGAHAAALGLRLLTRDARRYPGYFPTVQIVAP